MPISDDLLKKAADGYTNELVNGDVVSMALELQIARLIVREYDDLIRHMSKEGGDFDEFMALRQH